MLSPATRSSEPTAPYEGTSSGSSTPTHTRTLLTAATKLSSRTLAARESRKAEMGAEWVIHHKQELLPITNHL